MELTSNIWEQHKRDIISIHLLLAECQKNGIFVWLKLGPNSIIVGKIMAMANGEHILEQQFESLEKAITELRKLSQK